MKERVEMLECIFKPLQTGEETLETHGVSTCICLMIIGHQEDNSSFIGMYHWPGFEREFNSPGYTISNAIRDLTHFLVIEARKHLHILPSAPVFLDHFFSVGGEVKQTATDGELLVSGTELEVTALNTYIIQHCKRFFVVSENSRFSTKNYLTKDDEFLNITLSAAGPSWRLGKIISETNSCNDTDSEPQNDLDEKAQMEHDASHPLFTM
jgi:hypothetical protein